jgi:(S)-ureidoglycine-glyoxylate aminotransferase
MIAAGGPSTPDGRVLRALTTPLIGQFDPDFTAIMDDVVQLAREVFVTVSPHCFAISALATGGLEAVLNSVCEANARLGIGGGPSFVERTADTAERYGANVVGLDVDHLDTLVVPAIDPDTCESLPLKDLAAHAHARNAILVVDATLALGACELRVDDWAIDVCVAGADYGVGAPSGMSLVTYAPSVHARMLARAEAPTTHYLDLRQLQAYWSPERLNHHTAPTGLVYGLREALRLIQLEELTRRWRRHAEIGAQLRRGLLGMGLEISGDLPYSVVHLAPSADEVRLRSRLRAEFGVSVTRLGAHMWRLGLLGADAQVENAARTLAAMEKVLGA